MKKTILERIRILTYIKKSFSHANSLWFVEYPIDNLSHKEQKFVCQTIVDREEKWKVFPISFLRRRVSLIS